MALYAGGVSLGKVDLDATVRGSDYRVVSHLETDGVANAFWKSTIQATSSGTIGGKTLTPALYDSFNVRRDGKKQQVSLTYADKAPKLFAEPAYNTTSYSVAPDDIPDWHGLAAIACAGVAFGTLNPMKPNSTSSSGLRMLKKQNGK